MAIFIQFLSGLGLDSLQPKVPLVNVQHQTNQDKIDLHSNYQNDQQQGNNSGKPFRDSSHPQDFVSGTSFRNTGHHQDFVNVSRNFTSHSPSFPNFQRTPKTYRISQEDSEGSDEEQLTVDQ